MKLQENIDLAPYTTLKIGGPARFFVHAETEQDVVDALSFAREKGLEVFVLGGGSNLLVGDAGFDGLVIAIAIAGIDIDKGDDDSICITAGAGEDWDAFVSLCVARGYAGVECLSGIPGTVGGTPVQNVGAYGQEVSESILRVRCLDRRSLEIIELSAAECGFEYRKSIFNTVKRDRFIVLSVAFELIAGGAAKVVYKDLIDLFAGREPKLSDVRDAVLIIRRSKSMVVDPDDPNSRSAGSFFKNPMVSSDLYDKIASTHDRVPKFPAGKGMVKIPAAWLIENAGFEKGFRLGNAAISSNHTLALINCGGASATEIFALMRLIQKGVSDAFTIDLVPEPVFVGF